MNTFGRRRARVERDTNENGGEKKKKKDNKIISIRAKYHYGGTRIVFPPGTFVRAITITTIV